MAGARHDMCELTRHGMAGDRHGMCELTRHGMAGDRHGMCELVFIVDYSVRSTVAIPSSGQSQTKPKKIFFLNNIIPKNGIKSK
jgi:hypothetical protein